MPKMVFGTSTLRQHIKKRIKLASFILAFPLDDKTDTSILEPFKSKIGIKTDLVPLPQGEKWVEKVYLRFAFRDVISSLGNIDSKVYSARNSR